MTQYENLLKVMDRLLAPDGCPWDREQTHESLRANLLEECNEVIEAIASKDMTALCEELGDVLLQVVFHAKLAEKAGHFTTDDVARGITEKLVSRHTHIFGNDTATTAAEVAALWEANKRKERENNPI